MSLFARTGSIGLVGEDLGRLEPDERTVLRQLADSVVTVGELTVDGRRRGDGDAATEAATDLLARLRKGGWLATTVVEDGRPLYTVQPHRPPPETKAAPVPPGLTLSRFSLVRQDGDQLVMESPRSWCELHIHAPHVLALVGELVCGSDVSRPQPPEPVLARLRSDLVSAKMAVPPTDVEATALRGRQWSAHELWFHHRTRSLRSPAGHLGRTLWADGTFPPLPARHAPYRAPISLHRPDLDALRRTDPSLTTVLESRRSVRTHDDSQPLDLGQLGTFLYRCARNRWIRELDGIEYVSRPHPSGGGVCELELYPVVRHIDGLDAGMYHYDPESHCLELVCEMNPTVRRLLRAAAFSSTTGKQPQVLLLVAARFGRVMWAYEGMPYSLVLKHVGVLYQVMYSVATAMGLAACGLGGGDPDAFAAATGLDPLVEGSVGEFILGSLPPETEASPRR